MTFLEKMDINSFANRAFPSNLLIATPGLLGEHINIIKCFKDKNSNDITLDDIYQSNIDLMDFGFMTKQAILFFLPSFMKIIIESDLSEGIELIYVVVNGCLLKLAEDKKLREEIDLYVFYNKKELNLITQFLVWLDNNYYTVYDPIIRYAKEALDLYWYRFIDLNLYVVLYEEINFKNKKEIRKILSQYFLFDVQSDDKSEFIKTLNFSNLKLNMPNIILLGINVTSESLEIIVNNYLIPTNKNEDDFLDFVEGLDHYQQIIITKFLLYCRDIQKSDIASKAIDDFWQIYVDEFSLGAN